jgi:hypothetical protein
LLYIPQLPPTSITSRGISKIAAKIKDTVGKVHVLDGFKTVGGAVERKREDHLVHISAKRGICGAKYRGGGGAPVELH